MDLNEKRGKRPRIGRVQPADQGSYVRENRNDYSSENTMQHYGNDRPYQSRRNNNYDGNRGGYRNYNNYNNRYNNSDSENRPHRQYYAPQGEMNTDFVLADNENRRSYNGGNGYNRHNNQNGGGYRRNNNNNHRRYNNDGYNNDRQEGEFGSNNRQGGYNNNNNRRQGGGFNKQNRQGGRFNNNNGRQRYSESGMPRGGKSFVPRPRPVEYEQEIPDPEAQIRLNKFMANAGICSRREADEFIQQGLVKVNGVVVTELGTKISHSDTVEYDEKIVALERKAYILLNKPKDCVTTVDDPNGRMTVMDLVKGACNERIYPVGRLDRNTTGVLLLTNDGELASKLTHPKYVKKKIYHVWTDKDITEEDMQRIADGIELEDGPIHADAISYATETDRNQAGIEIHSGRNRIVRRIFEHLGYHVVKLDRVYFAGLTKKNVSRGRWRYLTQEEVNYLKMGSFE